MHYPNLRYSCLHCGYSCRTFDVELESVEVATIAGLVPDSTTERQRRWFLRRTECGDCVWHRPQRENGQCGLHANYGQEAKPARCRDFPFRAVSTPAGTFVGASFACQAIAEGHGPRLSAGTSSPRPRALPEVPLAPGHPFRLETYLEWECHIQTRMTEQGRAGLAIAARELAASVGQVAEPERLKAALQKLEGSLLALAEGPWNMPGGEERLDALLLAHESGGRFYSRVAGTTVDVGEVRRRWEEPWTLWPLAHPFFEHLIFRKYLLEGPDVLSRVASLPTLADLLQFWALVHARSPSRSDLNWALRQLEQRLTFHARGGEAFMGHFAAAYLDRFGL